MHTPATGVVRLRDAVSQKPLTFEVFIAKSFIDSTLKIFTLAPKPADRELTYIELDLTCIAPIVVTRQGLSSFENEYKRIDAIDHVLGAMKSQSISTTGHSLAVLISEFLRGNKKLWSDKSNMLHLSLYTPSARI